MRKNIGIFLVPLLILLSTIRSSAQVCDSIVPVDTVDLSNDPNGSYVTGILNRQGLCCGVSGGGNTKCFLFILYLNPLAEGVLVDLETGAGAFGNLYYQVGCGTATSFGTPLCLNGPGPHQVTFCKSGGNAYSLRITSVAEPVLPDSVSINDGCSKEVGTIGFDKSTIQWTTVYPDTAGAYNNYLSCTSGCDTITVTPQPGYPPYIDIQACGLAYGGCDTVGKCDTVRVNFYSTLAVEILPKNPTICFGTAGTNITANPQGGSAPYVYRWFENDTSGNPFDSTQTVFVDTGTYIVELGDISGCPPTYDTVVVTSFTAPIQAIAGGDTFTCLENFPIPLNGQIIAAAGGQWYANGIFNPSDTSLTTTFTPDPQEIANGFVDIQLVTTGNGTCPADTDFITIDLLQFNANVSTDSVPVSCTGGADGQAHVSAIGPRPLYTFAWDSATGYQTTQTASNLPAGTYSVTITDSAGCILDTNVTVIEPDTVLGLSIAVGPVPCNGGNQGWALPGITGGVPPYQVIWDSKITSFSGDSAVNLVSDTFTLTVKDNFGCQIDTFFYISQPPIPLSVAMTKVNVSCKNGIDGSATATPSGGTAPYMYMWNDSTGFQTTQTAINLKAGIYDVIVTDTNGCSHQDTITITEPNSNITFTDTFSFPSCYGFNDGTATVYPSGGVPPYTYLWDSTTGFQTTQVATGLGAGTYSVTIFDQNGCLYGSPIIVIDPQPLFATAIEIINVTCKGGANGSAKASPSGGSAPYTFLWDSLTGFQTDSVAVNLKAGSYSVFVYDQFGCSYVPSIVISEPDDSLIINTSIVPVSCKGGSDGKAIGIPFGGTLPYTIQWNAAANNQTTDTASGLSAGSYMISVTDSNNCQADSVVIVTEPPALLIPSASTLPVGCKGESTGTALVSPVGGIPPYAVAWDSLTGYQTGDTAFNLPAGTYTVFITDDNNCQRDTSVVVTEPDSLQMAGAQQNINCYGEQTGWTFVSISGGTTPYSYQWDSLSGFQTADSATNLPAGNHRIVVTDSNGCTIDSSFILTEPQAPIVLSTGSQAVTCFGDSNGLAYVTATGGTPPYSYQWASNANSQTSDTAFNLAVGTYSIVVIDSLNCSENFAASVLGPPSPLSLTTFSLDVACSGDSTGKAAVNVSGGSSPYTIHWDNQTGNQTGDTAFGLPAGTYSVTVLDTFGCQIDTAVSLTEPTPIQLTGFKIDVGCFGDQTGWAIVVASGGVSPYTYQWDSLSGFQMTDSATNLPAGNHTVLVTDTNGCTADSTFILTQPSAPLSTSTGSVGITCYGDSNGLAYVTPAGGTMPYSYLWSPNAKSQTTDTAFNLKKGWYLVQVTDGNACKDVDSVSVYGPPMALQMQLFKKDVKCFDGSDGKAYAFKAGGTPPYSHSWSTPVGPQTGDTATGLTVGTVYYTLTDSSGCSLQDSITLSQPPEVLLTLSQSDTICIGDSAVISGVGSGGNGGPFSYLLLPFQPVTFPMTVTPIANKTFGFRAVDNKGCQSQTGIVNIFVRDLSKDSIDVTVSGNVCLGDTVLVTGYHSSVYPGINISWNTGNQALQFSHVPQKSRYYTLTISDVCALTVKDSAFVEVYALPEIDLNDIIAAGCIPLTVNFSNLSQDPTITNYLWTFGDGNTSIDPMPIYTYEQAGQYKIGLIVLNIHGCRSTNDTSNFVNAFANPTASFTSNPPLTDQRTPIVQFISTSSPNKKKLVHRWDFSDAGTSDLRDPIHAFLDSGTFFVQLRVVDTNGCVDSTREAVVIKPYFNLEIPNAFTPNKSGSSGGHYDPNATNNWVFYPRTQGVDEYELQIFNRWGELLFESKDHSIGWDGYYRGRMASQEVYVWKLKIQWENGQSYEGIGDVTLFR